MKLLCGIVLLSLSALWGIFWCAQFSSPLSAYDGSQAVFVLVASLALIPVFWATSLLDAAWRAPLAPTTTLIARPVRERHIEAKTKSDDQPTGLAPDERGRELADASIANASAETQSPTPVAA